MANLLSTFASLPLMREAKPKALTEGEKNSRYALSLSLLRWYERTIASIPSACFAALRSQLPLPQGEPWALPRQCRNRQSRGGAR